MTKRLTKRDKFAMLFSLVADSTDPDKDMLSEFIAHEMELLASKDKSTSAAERERKALQEAIKAEIVTVLTDADQPLTATEIARACEVSVQRVSALIKQIPTVERLTSGKKVVFTIK